MAQRDEAMTPEELAAIEARTNAAMSGPWELDPPESRGDCFTVRKLTGTYTIARIMDLDNARFIWRARRDVPALIARVRELEAENEALRKIAARVLPCHYCSVDDLAKCPHGFPGCSLADDMNEEGCANSWLRKARERVRELEVENARLRTVEEESRYLINNIREHGIHDNWKSVANALTAAQEPGKDR